MVKILGFLSLVVVVYGKCGRQFAEYAKCSVGLASIQQSAYAWGSNFDHFESLVSQCFVE